MQIQAEGECEFGFPNTMRHHNSDILLSEIYIQIQAGGELDFDLLYSYYVWRPHIGSQPFVHLSRN